jgi:hypothetical protein
MSEETTEKKSRKTPARKAAAPKSEGKAKAAPKVRTAKAKEPAAERANVKQWPSHEQIAMLAHRYYEERGWQHGFHEEDWLRAEQELLAAS